MSIYTSDDIKNRFELSVKDAISKSNINTSHASVEFGRYVIGWKLDDGVYIEWLSVENEEIQENRLLLSKHEIVKNGFEFVTKAIDKN